MTLKTSFTKNEEQTLDSLVAAFDKETTIQIAVVTIDSAMTSKDSLDAFTLRLANAWGVGQKSKNNGIVIGISTVYRKIRIENGYGIVKILTDDETKQIMDTAFLPHFRNGEFFKGTMTGLKVLMKTLKERS